MPFLKIYWTLVLTDRIGSLQCSNFSQEIFMRYCLVCKENTKLLNRLMVIVKQPILVLRYGKQVMILLTYQFISTVS